MMNDPLYPTQSPRYICPVLNFPVFASSPLSHRLAQKVGLRSPREMAVRVAAVAAVVALVVLPLSRLLPTPPGASPRPRVTRIPVSHSSSSSSRASSLLSSELNHKCLFVVFNPCNTVPCIRRISRWVCWFHLCVMNSTIGHLTCLPKHPLPVTSCVTLPVQCHGRLRLVVVNS